MRYLGLTATAVVMLCSARAATAQANNHPFAASFNLADKNKDGFLDAAELAKVFRGPNAKVIQDKPGLREIHPDHAFMDTWDANKDGKISRPEFDKYEAQALAAARAAANRSRSYTRAGRGGYRSPLRHRGYTVRRGVGSNPYTAALRSQQRAYQRQRAAYTNLRRYGVYTPSVRGGYRGIQRHHNIRRR